MGVCLFIYAFVGHYKLDPVNPQSTPQAGNIMIVFTCLFIAAFATTWGPLVWVSRAIPYCYHASELTCVLGHCRRTLPSPLPRNLHGPSDRQQLAF
jgi:hypothetical protein